MKRRGIFDTLKNHKEKEYISLHMPGHKSGTILPDRLREAFGENVFSYDLTEVAGLDNLQDPRAAIKETEDKIKDFTGAQEVNMLVNGSTAGLLAAIYSLAKDQEIFVATNSHQAVYNGLLLANAYPIWLATEVETATGTELGVDPETLAQAIKIYPDCKLLLLTYPNYYGLRYKTREIFKLAKEKGLIIIVDEAHGAHYNFLPEEYPTAIELGADLVVQSWHKSLPVLNQGSLLLKAHSQKELQVRQAVNLFQTSSPSYLILASMDLAFDFLYEERAGLAQSAKKWQTFTQDLQDLPLKNLRIFTCKEKGGLSADPFKVLIYTASYPLEYCQKIIVDKYKLQAEIFEEGRLLFMLALFYEESLADRIKQALLELDSLEVEVPASPYQRETFWEKILKLKENPASLDRLDKKRIPLEESLGKRSAQKILKYPPGVPLLFPGQILTEEIVCYLKKHKINYSLQDGIDIFIDQEKDAHEGTFY